MTRPHPRRNGRARTRAAADGVAGSMVASLPLLLWLLTLLTVVSVDLGGHLVAVSRAATLADGAALAAVSADASARPEAPEAAASRVVAAGNGRLEACDCARGREQARVVVSVAVPGIVWPRLGTGRVHADAEAALVGGTVRHHLHGG